MEEDSPLDIIDKAATMKATIPNKGHNIALLFFALCSLVVSSCCSLPRIIVLDDPLTPEEHLHLGAAYEKRGELVHAIKEYNLAAEKLPLAYFYLGNVYFQKKELNEAEKYYKEAIKKDPQNADAHNNLAWLYYTKKKNLDEAKGLILKALELNPSKGDIYRDTLGKIEEFKKIGSSPKKLYLNE